ncbi:MAG: GNAT family protein [Bacteroidota bacterium]
MNTPPISPDIHTLAIQTERLHLRPYEEKDASSLFRMISSNVDRLQQSAPLTTGGNLSEQASKEFIQKRNREALTGKWIFLGIFHRETNQLMGQLSIMKIDTRVGKCEFGYLLGNAFEGKGYMTEAVKAVISYCFGQLHFRKVSLMIGLFNQASMRVAERCGFSAGGVMRREYKSVEGKLIDVRYYDILPEEWSPSTG